MPTSSHKQCLSWAQKKQLPRYRLRTHPGTVFGQCLKAGVLEPISSRRQCHDSVPRSSCGSQCHLKSQQIQLHTTRLRVTDAGASCSLVWASHLLSRALKGPSICYHHSTVQSSSKGCCRLEPVTSWYSFFPNSTR